MWTSIPKPTGTPYTWINPSGRQTYDDSDVLYDDPNVFYDGVDMSAWTDIPKPVGTSGSIYGGMTIGLLMPLTIPKTINTPDTSWTNIPKPI